MNGIERLLAMGATSEPQLLYSRLLINAAAGEIGPSRLRREMVGFGGK